MSRIAFLLILMCLLAACSSAFFYPQRPLQLTPARVGLEYEDVNLESPDHLRLHAWYLPAQGTPKGTVLFLHGNAGNIGTHLASVYWLPPEGYNVFLLDYRGYGASEGSVSIGGALQDVEAAIDWLTTRPEVRSQGLAVFGQSLGGAFAAYAVANSRHRDMIRALIMDSAFSSYRNIAREKLADFWLTWPVQWPLSLTVSDVYDPVDAIGKVSPVPVLIMHGVADRVIPVWHADRLFTAAREPKEFWRIPGSGHIEALGREEYRIRFKRYLDDLFVPASADIRQDSDDLSRRSNFQRVISVFNDRFSKIAGDA